MGGVRTADSTQVFKKLQPLCPFGASLLEGENNLKGTIELFSYEIGVGELLYR